MKQTPASDGGQTRGASPLRAELSGPSLQSVLERAAGSSRGRVVGWYLLSRLLVWVAMALVVQLAGKTMPEVLHGLWDARWYTMIAAHGYPAHHAPMVHQFEGFSLNQWSIAYLPGLPLAIAGLHALGMPIVASGLLISFAGGLVAALAVLELGRTAFGEAVGERAATLFCLFPGALVFSWIYSEGLALAFGLWALVFLVRRRWALAGALAAVAGAVHSDVAVALSLACVVAAGLALYRTREWKALVAPALAPLGMLGYLAYLQVHTGSWRNWLLTQRYGWRQHVDFGKHTLLATGNALLSPTMVDSWLPLAGAVFAILVLVALWRRRAPAPMAVMAIAVLALATASTEVGLRPRSLLLAAAAFPSVAALLGDRGSRVLTVCFAGLAPVLVVAYMATPLHLGALQLVP